MFKVLTGNRDQIEQQLIDYLFSPGTCDQRVLAAFDDCLKPRGEKFISLIDSTPVSQALLHQSASTPD